MKHLRLLFCSVMLLMTILLCACNKTEDIPPDDAEISTVFRIEQIELPDTFRLKSEDLCISGGKVIIGGWSKIDPDKPWEDQKRLTGEIDPATGEITLNELGIFDPDGWNILSVSYSDAGEKFIVKGLQRETFYEEVVISRQSADGTELASYDCAELFLLDLSHFKIDAISGNGGFYIRAVLEQDGFLYIVSNTGIVRIAKNGAYTRIESRNEISTAALTDSGILLFFNGNRSSKPAYADFDAGKLVDVNITQGNGGSFVPFPLKGYEFGVLMSRSGLYGYQKNETDELEEVLLCDFNASDISGDIFNAASISAQEFYIVRYDFVENTNRLYKLTMIKPEDIVEKIHLSVAMFGFIDTTVQNAITDFNLTNEHYHLDIKLYSTTDENGGVNSNDISALFEKDIVSGNIPDILVTNDFLNISYIENYAQKGMFCDLYTLMENAGWDKTQLLECVTESFERNNSTTGRMELPYLPLVSNVQTLYGKTSDFSGRLTLDTVLDKLDSLKDDQRLIDYTRLEYFLCHTLEEFIDDATGEIEFDTPVFRRYCEMYKRADEFWRMDIQARGNDIYAAFREGISLLTSCDLENTYKYFNFLTTQESDDIIEVGYPDRDSSGILLKPRSVFAISETCENKDTAFAFLASLLQDKYFGSSPHSGNSIPLITMEILDNFLENFSRYIYFNEQYTSYGMTPPEDEETDYYYIEDALIENYRAMLLSARAESPVNDKIMDIIREELSTYTARSDLSLDEVIKHINSRVSIYYNEQMK